MILPNDGTTVQSGFPSSRRAPERELVEHVVSEGGPGDTGQVQKWTRYAKVHPKVAGVASELDWSGGATSGGGGGAWVTDHCER